MRNKKSTFLKDKVNKTEKYSNNKKGIDEFKKGYQPMVQFIKIKPGDLLVDYHSTTESCKTN